MIAEKKTVLSIFFFASKNSIHRKLLLFRLGILWNLGIDSVFLVEHCGLNRMGKGGPRAGAPLANIQILLDGLTKAGFSVVVLRTNGNSKMDENKILAEIVTPSSPVYTYGLAMDRYRSHANFPILLLNLALSPPKQDLRLSKFIPMYERRWFVRGLPEAAHIILKRYGGRFNRLFVHESLPKKFLKSWQIAPEQCVPISGYTVLQFPTRMEMIKIDLSLICGYSFYHSEEKRKDLSPKPLYQERQNKWEFYRFEEFPILWMRCFPYKVRWRVPKICCVNIFFNLHQKILRMIYARLSTLFYQVDASARLSGDESGTLCQNSSSTRNKSSNFAWSFSGFQKVFSPVIKLVSCHVFHMFYMLFLIFLICPFRRSVTGKKSHIITHLLNPVIPLDRDEASIPQHEGEFPSSFESIEDEFRGRWHAHQRRIFLGSIFKCEKRQKLWRNPHRTAWCTYRKESKSFVRYSQQSHLAPRKYHSERTRNLQTHSSASIAIIKS